MIKTKENIGDVIKFKDGNYVITEIINGRVSEYTRLEDYIAKNALVNMNNELVTIQSVIDERCRLYISENAVIDKSK